VIRTKVRPRWATDDSDSFVIAGANTTRKTARPDPAATIIEVVGAALEDDEYGGICGQDGF
jgi:hypothetical protein